MSAYAVRTTRAYPAFCIFFKKVLISRNKQVYLNQRGKKKKPAFEEQVFIAENDLKGGSGEASQYTRERCTWFRNTKLFWLIKTHPQWKHEGFTMIVKSTTSSVRLANVSASAGLANSALIPTDKTKWLQSFCENTDDGYQAMTSKVPKADSWWGSYPLGWLTSGSRMGLRGTRLTGSHGLWKDRPTPQLCDEYGRILFTWERLPGAFNHRASQGGETKPFLGQESIDACKHCVWQQHVDSVGTLWGLTTLRSPSQQALGILRHESMWQKSPNLRKPGGQRGKQTSGTAPWGKEHICSKRTERHEEQPGWSSELRMTTWP